jgi:hypothetical protein
VIQLDLRPRGFLSGLYVARLSCCAITGSPGDPLERYYEYGKIEHR